MKPGGGVIVDLDSWSNPFWVRRLVETLVSGWSTDRLYKEGLESPGDFTDGETGMASPLPLPTAKRQISLLKFLRKSFLRVSGSPRHIATGQQGDIVYIICVMTD